MTSAPPNANSAMGRIGIKLAAPFGKIPPCDQRFAMPEPLTPKTAGASKIKTVWGVGYVLT